MVVDVYPLCAVQAMMAYLVRQGNAPGALFMPQDGCLLSCTLHTDWLRHIVCGRPSREFLKP